MAGPGTMMMMGNRSRWTAHGDKGQKGVKDDSKVPGLCNC